jgi:deoxyinosine 3'endonuclease (endonuclease V)
LFLSLQVRRGDKIGTEASYIPTDLYLNELQEYLFMTNQVNSSFDVYLSTDDHDILKNIEKK